MKIGHKSEETVTLNKIVVLKDPIKLDLAEIWTDDYAHQEGLGHGVRFMGESSSKIQMGNYVNQTEPAFWITWSSPDPKANRGVFHYEFTGLSFAGGTDNTLVQFGPHVAWNSCKFEVVQLHALLLRSSTVT